MGAGGVRQVEADTVIVATGAVARRMDFPGAGECEGGYWNKGISACAVCDGAAPIFRNKPLAVIGGGDTAMEEASYLTKYGSKVYIIHRRDEFRASKIMQTRALSNPKIEARRARGRAPPRPSQKGPRLRRLSLRPRLHRSVFCHALPPNCARRGACDTPQSGLRPLLRLPLPRWPPWLPAEGGRVWRAGSVCGRKLLTAPPAHTRAYACTWCASSAQHTRFRAAVLCR